jgi:hypothetical protein
MNSMRHREKGAVSLFIVIFAALLIITIGTAFIRIMLQDQSQASTNDLSKSALDSAYAGVEDAKRAIVEYYQHDCSKKAPGDDTRCDALDKAIVGKVGVNDGWTTTCQATIIDRIASLSNGTTGEVLVKTNSEDSDLNQAYTCVNIQMNPVDVIGSSTSKFIPLKSKDGASFTKIKIQWYTKQLGQTLNLDHESPGYNLPDKWPDNRPAVMRAQLIQYKEDAGFHITDFDNNSNDNYNSTLFLLPSEVGGNTTSFGLDFRQKNNSGAAQHVDCKNSPVESAYACEETITLPDVGTSKRIAYLNISQYYSAINTDFRVTMLNDAGDEVPFTDVQPVVDSTGRANDIFRRIRSRIDLGVSNIPTPNAVDVTRSLCKEFIVTNDAAYPGSHGNGVCPVPR